MDVEHGVEGRFSATHKSCPEAGWRHGHLYAVTAFSTGELSATGRMREAETMHEVVDQACRELQHQDLDQVLVGAITSVAGLASTFIGQWSARFPKLTEVVVRDERTGETGRARRTPRVL